MANSEPSLVKQFEHKSPLELLEGKAPSLLNEVVFGSTCMVYRDSNGRTFKKRATRGIILGVPEGTKRYRDT
jgi:hypothetical protein